jgi:hypothetical protein
MHVQEASGKLIYAWLCDDDGQDPDDLLDGLDALYRSSNPAGKD